MNGLAWVVVAYIATNGTVQVTKAGLNYRTAKRRDQARQGSTS